MPRDHLITHTAAHHVELVEDLPHPILITTGVTRAGCAPMRCLAVVDDDTGSISISSSQALTTTEVEALARAIDAGLRFEIDWSGDGPPIELKVDGITVTHDGRLFDDICQGEYLTLAAVWESRDASPEYLDLLYTRGWVRSHGDGWALTPEGRAQISDPAYRCHACRTWTTCRPWRALVGRCQQCHGSVEILYIPGADVEEVSHG